MTVNRFWADAKVLCYFAIVLAFGYAGQNFKFAFGQIFAQLRKLYSGLGLIGNDALAFSNAQYAITDYIRWRVFYEETVNAGVIKFFKKCSSGNPGDNGKFGFRRPPLSFFENVQTVRARHAQVKKCAIRLMGFDGSNSFNTVFRSRDDFKPRHGVDHGAHAFDGKRMIIRDNDCLHNCAPTQIMDKLSQVFRRCRLKRAIILPAVAMLMTGSVQAQASSEYLDISGPQDAAALADHIDYYLDATWEKNPADLLGVNAPDFKPIETEEPNFGYIDDRVWLRVKLRNVSPSTDEWKLYVRENFLQYYDVFVVREDRPAEQLESHNPDTHFSGRSFDFPELVTPFQFEPGEQVTVLISYSSGGSSHAALSIETADSFSVLAISRTSKNFISYGMMAILIIAAGLALLILRMEVFSAYVGYVFVTLLYLMHTDGVAFQYIWPNRPHFNANFTIIVGTLFVMVTYNFARVFLQTKIYYPRIDKLFQVLCWSTPALVVPAALIDTQFTKQALIVLILIGITAGTLTGLLAATTRFRQVRFYLFAWICGVLTAGMMNMRHLFGFDIAQDTEFDAIRVSIIVDAIMMGLGIADHYTQTIRARRKAADRTLSETQKNLRLSTRLNDLEQQYLLATELAASRDEDLKNTVHDLRQPLHALRLNVQGLRDGQAVGEAGDIDDTFTYLEALIADQLERSVSDVSLPPQEEAGSDRDLSLPKILRSIHEMFLPDAKEAGLDFRFVETTSQTDVEPLALMRIVTNLVANAIKYTPEGRVLLGVRRAGGSLRIEVHDTGPGLTAASFEKARKRSVRLNARNENTIVPGEGYGLAIASDLAKKHGLTLRVSPNRRTGTGVILDVPAIKSQ